MRSRSRSTSKEKVHENLLGMKSGAYFGGEEPEKKFVWEKKIQKIKETKGAVDLKKLRERDEKELQKELEKAKNRRAQREMEEAIQEEERKRLMKERGENTFSQWQEKEAFFHKEQEKARATLRIRHGRDQPIDKLAKVALILQGKLEYNPGLEYEIKEPYTIIEMLALKDLNDLSEKIQAQIEVEENQMFLEYWQQLLVLASERLQKLQYLESGQNMKNPVSEFDEDINAMLEDKGSYSEISKFEDEINQSLSSKDFKMDVEFYENVLKKIKIKKARLYLKELGENYFKERQDVHNYGKQITRATLPKISTQGHDTQTEYDPGNMSPLLADANDKSFDMADENGIADVINDQNELIDQRYKVFQEQCQILIDKVKESQQIMATNESQNVYTVRNMDVLQNTKVYLAKELFEGDKNRPIQASEENFDDVLDVKANYDWATKYKPRKPHYFNRVKLGYEWNKYNQLHYDTDNPPPKVVQGYKFNIFYPDLIEKTKAPEYFLEPAENPEFCMIRFHAGPPYEDIAFKIVNREWEYSDKYGFKCVFDRGILHLYFNFLKYRYRR